MPTLPWRIVFMGTPAFAVPTLERLCAGPDPVVGVFTQPDKPVGRGLKLRPSPVKQWAERQKIPLWQPFRLRSPESATALRALQPDLIVVVAYGQILSPEILAIPRHGCLNIHASLLPRWRGAAPVQRALLAGDPESGVTLMQMEAGLDTGPILSQRRLPLPPHMSGGELHDQLSQLGATLLQESLPHLKAQTLIATPQPKEGITYAAKITPQDAHLDWNQPAAQLKQQIDALNPWPAARTLLNGKSIKLFRCRLGTGMGKAGQQIATHKEGPEIACGQGSVLLTELQPAGKRRMAAAEWLHGQTPPKQWGR